jgi:hypothetical protein
MFFASAKLLLCALEIMVLLQVALNKTARQYWEDAFPLFSQKSGMAHFLRPGLP